MKKIAFGFCALILAISCQKKVASDEQQTIAEEPQELTRACATEEVFQRQLEEDPSLAQRMASIEQFTKNAIERGRLVNGVIEIPVVVNVVYKTAAQNISDAQIASQITVLNEDYNNTNADGANTPAEWNGLRANYGIRFVLDQVIRKSTNKTSWGTNDAVKKSSLGGIDPTSPTTKLNIWVCNLGQSLLGYAQFPGGNSATDGVVILYSAFGSRAKAAGTYATNYDLGRTATHEIGHWLNLRHIWGDASCGNDLVGDTPVAQTSNGGCPAYPKVSACSPTHNEMTMNYMDYTYDRCMYMFTNGQKSRSLAVFAAGGPRAAFAQ
ncbi:zinc metalloprotease [Flaviaesturariibacter flavus]|uniref:Zinc metalloprotease n=1 Tax=Flaviaesturariibacter flavus TaxID=2502780 RepID=A0A4R1BAW2_9BACT|nr:zinc metalloprotease [Flaviaesturariibacter flavus]TCJ14115.1 zinc metalloprotease [Flaviaesturariibacter flavus]